MDFNLINNIFLNSSESISSNFSNNLNNTPNFEESFEMFFNIENECNSIDINLNLSEDIINNFDVENNDSENNKDFLINNTSSFLDIDVEYQKNYEDENLNKINFYSFDNSTNKGLDYEFIVKDNSSSNNLLKTNFDFKAINDINTTESNQLDNNFEMKLSDVDIVNYEIIKNFENNFSMDSELNVENLLSNSDTNKENVFNQIKDGIISSLSTSRHIKMQLKPQGLGCVGVNIKVINGKINLEFVVDNSFVENVVSESINQLESILNSSGLLVVDNIVVKKRCDNRNNILYNNILKSKNRNKK